MWKLLKKLVAKWSYRCEHNWVLEINVRKFEYRGVGRPHTVERVYRCTKCCAFNRLLIQS